MTRDLQVVLKVSERCNINCTYCYYYNHGNDAPLERPAFVTQETVQGLIRFSNRARQLVPDLGTVWIILHGGEPLLLKKRRFRALCSEFSEKITGVKLGVTTNGMLIDSEWIDIFSEYDIGVAVSIDGPREYHDRERVDFRGRGTYSRVAEGIGHLRSAATAGKIGEPSALATIDIRSRGDVVYHHLVRELGFRKSLDFNLPKLTHDSNPSAALIAGVGRYLLDAFREWVEDDDPNIHVRVFDKYMSYLLGRAGQHSQNPIVMSVTSDGDIRNDDTLWEVQPPLFTASLNVARDDITTYLAELNKGALAELATPHEECARCSWFKLCRPPAFPDSNAVLRYKSGTRFRNRLVFCEAYQELFVAMTEYIRAARTSPAAVAA